MSAKHVFETVAAIQRLCASLCEHTTFVLLTPARTMTIIDKITILCNDVNKASTSIELLAIHVLHYMSKRSHVGLGIKSMAGLKPSSLSGMDTLPPLPPLGHVWDVMLVWTRGILCYSIVYYYNGAQRYEQFLQVGRLYRALILLGLAPCLPSTSVSSSFMVLYIYFLKFSYILLFTF